MGRGWRWRAEVEARSKVVAEKILGRRWEGIFRGEGDGVKIERGR